MKAKFHEAEGPRRRRRIAFSFLFLGLSMWTCLAAGQDDAKFNRTEKPGKIQEEKGPSFDCAKASTKVERAICDYKYLSDLDRQLDNVYKQIRATPEIRGVVRQEQLKWLRNERAKCENSEGMAYDSIGPKIVSCLRSAYLDRIQELNAISHDHLSGEEAAVSKDDENKVSYGLPKAPIEFLLIEGGQYQLCRDYVDMLNQTGYADPPICERKILPDFPKFRPIKWSEITDKEEIRRIKKEQMMMEAMWPPGRQENAEKLWLSERRKMESGVYPNLHKADIDIDYTGVVNTVYRFSVLKPILKKYGICTDSHNYFVKYADENMAEEVYGRPLGPVTTLNSTSGLNRLFYYDNRVFLDFWDTAYQYQLTVAEIGRGPMKQVCGVNIVQ